VFERRGVASFALETLAGLGVLSQLFWEKFQGYATAEALIFRLVDHAHSAATKLFQDAVMGDDLANHERLC
jgi:hypothetical protein